MSSAPHHQWEKLRRNASDTFRKIIVWAKKSRKTESPERIVKEHKQLDGIGRQHRGQKWNSIMRLIMLMEKSNWNARSEISVNQIKISSESIVWYGKDRRCGLRIGIRSQGQQQIVTDIRKEYTSSLGHHAKAKTMNFEHRQIPFQRHREYF